MYKLLVGVVAGTLVLAAAVPAQEAPGEAYRDTSGPPAIAPGTPPSGSITLSGGSVAAGIGYVWGRGTLKYGDKHYKFKLSGVSVVDIGAASITASGDVYNLAAVQDFDGLYQATVAGATIGGGGSVAYLSNGKGVVIKLQSTTEGLRFNLSADGVRIKLKS
jgi:hypothetical protein